MTAKSQRIRNWRMSFTQSLVILVALVLFLAFIGYEVQHLWDGASHNLFITVAAMLIGCQAAVTVLRYQQSRGDGGREDDG